MEINLKKASLILGIIISLGIIIGFSFRTYNHFAKKVDVVELKKVDHLLAETIEMGNIEHQIYQQEQQIQRFDDIPVMRNRELTEVEKEEREKKKTRLKKLEKKREIKEEYYEELRK
jgi:hypothetical protein